MRRKNRVRIDHPINRSRSDFTVETFRSGGPGGQHQNSTDSGVRIRCKITGLYAEAREHRSQHDNRALAFRKLAGMLKEHYFGDGEKDRYGAGSHRVRTYHEPDDRVTDHDTGQVYSYRQTVAKGDIAEMIEDRGMHKGGGGGKGM